MAVEKYAPQRVNWLCLTGPQVLVRHEEAAPASFGRHPEKVLTVSSRPD
jgi:hypothetical protein